jgi:PAS domain S-box-containing protein
MNPDGVTQCSAAVAPGKEESADGMAALLRRELEQSRRKLDRCQKRLEQMDGLFAHVADAVFVVECDGQIIEVNPATSALFGYSKEEFLVMYPWDFVTSIPRAEILAAIDSLKNGVPSSLQCLCRAKNGVEKAISLHLNRNDFCGRDLVVVTGRDVTNEQRVNADLEKALNEIKRSDIEAQTIVDALRAGENKILEMVATGKPLAVILEELCCMVDRVSIDSMASVLLVDSSDCLRTGAAPRFPKNFISLIDGIKIGPTVGSCGTAAYKKKQVIVTDIETDPLWNDYRELARQYGLRAGWSTPILSSDRSVLGVFGIYWDKPRGPSPAHLYVIDQITHLASVAIERERAVEALRASEKLARGQTEALTLALDALARESDPNRIVEHVLRTVTAQLDAHSNSVWLRDETSELMVFEFALENGKFKTKTEATIAAVSPSLPVQAISPWPEIFRTGKPSVLEDIRKGPEFPWRARVLAQGVVTILVVPMMIAGKVKGVIGVRFAQKRTFRAEELELAQALANQAMLAIQLASLSAQNRQSAIIEERNRMARDIHDTLAQGFTGVILHLEAAEEAMARERMEVVSGHLRGAGEIARDGLREARRSVQALRPLALEQKKLTEALEEMIMKQTTGTAMQAKFTLQGELRELPPEWDANILRIGQEALTNVLRHARATEFRMILIFHDHEIRLNMHDNGCGFDPAGKYSGFGLQGMAERTEDMEGQLTIQSVQGRGTTISIALPVTTSAELEKS